MDNFHQDLSDKESTERRNSNTEWLPTKCRITKPPPPKPATNPLQFIKVAPCPLFQKAQEQIKKVEEIKIMRQDIKDEPEDWQQNLDNWKSSRRKRQEHIIERVVEVKKLGQEEHGKERRKSKTFNEMLEERNKRGQRLNIPIYDDDSNDLSDYGIGSSSSKTNSIKDIDTDDSSSFLDDKDHISDAQSIKDTSSASNQSQSEDELSSNIVDKENNLLNTKKEVLENTNSTNYYVVINKTSETNKIPACNTNFQAVAQPQYTYEGAIQDYRSRIKSKINVNETIFNKQDYLKSNEMIEQEKMVPKVDIFKRKEIFEAEKALEIQYFQSSTSRRLSEDFANSQSIKERLKSLEKCSDQPLKSVDKNSSPVGSVKSRINSLNSKQVEVDTKNNNNNNNLECVNNSKSPSESTKSISCYLLDKSSNNIIVENKNKANLEGNGKQDNTLDRCSSPEAEMYMNKLNMFNRDLDAFLGKPSHLHHGLEDYSTASGLSSDREDSGIHTADVSCSVSQADEPIEDPDLSATTIPNCIEKLNKEKENQLIEENKSETIEHTKHIDNTLTETFKNNDNVEENINNLKSLINSTAAFLNALQQQANVDFANERENMRAPIIENLETTQNLSVQKEINMLNSDFKQVITTDTSTSKNNNNYKILEQVKNKPVIYENVGITNFNTVVDDVFGISTFPLAPPKATEPPKEKPPPPPPPDEEDQDLEMPKENKLKKVNSTKRIKKEIHIKRSSFLGLDEPTDDQLDPEVLIDRPPDINTFLQKESQLEKSLYKKLQGSRDICLSEVESQDSGLESERGRLSSDTWCSSFGDSSTPTHGRQDSEQTNSVTSEEDEITKKEREIIELVEKEEKSRDHNDYSSANDKRASKTNNCCVIVHNTPKNTNPEQFNIQYFPPQNTTYKTNIEEQDSEVLKVEHELLQLEREELKRQRENVVFRESCAKIYNQNNNRRSLENICDMVDIFPQYANKSFNHRKSMPELLNNDALSSDYRKSILEAPYYYKAIPDVEVQYRKSMPDIQQAYLRSVPDYNKSILEVPHNQISLSMEQRKSMPELQQDVKVSAFRSPPAFNRQPIMPGKPLRPLVREQREKERLGSMDGDNVKYQNVRPGRPIARLGAHALSAVPKSRHIPNDNWIQPKANADNKNKKYNQHWLYQEAELRRLSEQQKNGSPKRNWQPTRQEKHIPEPIIQTLTQRVQSRSTIIERNQAAKRPENTTEFTPHPYLGHSHTMGHASPVAYPPPATLEDSQGKMLSVSGKKKCSYCGNELGRGAAMIIESLCLFYHMECFKCCVCHTQLGDGLMGTDVRVRNQKLHCHNCYSSDDGVKFSCV